MRRSKRFFFRGSAVWFVALCLTAALPGCTSDREELEVCDTTAAGFAANVKPLTDTYCATAGCHVPGGGGNGDFTSYAGLKAKVDNGTFRMRVFDMKGTGLAMPPSSSPVPTELEYQVLKCWLDGGALND